MSLLEDIVDVLHLVLEYFGVPPEMLVPVWNSQLCGQYRSIVRMIGTNLPLEPIPRVHFQIPTFTYRPHSQDDTTAVAPTIPTFADVLWVFEDEGDHFAKTRNQLPPNKLSTVNRGAKRHPGLNVAKRGGQCIRPVADPDPLQKISALESELLRLRAQIAMIVTTAPASGPTESHNAPCSPLMSPAPLPTLTSTPRSAAPPPPPPPPPPPLPPPCSGSSTETMSVQELIRQRRTKGKDKSQLQAQSEVQGMPSMLDVLKDMNKVKLRTVERSPGGTPSRKRRSKGGPASLSDPAALIAEALKRKFAQHRHNCSSDKENSYELSPFSSPETSKVPSHNRRSHSRLHV